MPVSDTLASIPLLDGDVGSLIAVEIRAWFSKELSVDVPVMQVLGEASIRGLSEYRLAQMNA
ncbi:putative secondary metabolism biosynthetic enzyme [Microsporum audouinii]